MKGPTGARGFEKAIGLATKDTDLAMQPARAKHCFGMSKMTILDENEKAALKFNSISQVEFYEYIARLAAEKYKEVRSWSLAEKINKTLDIIFKKFKIKRIKVGEKEDDDIASSDESVDMSLIDTKKQLLVSRESIFI